MTEDEVRQWLSDDEIADAWPIPDEPSSIRPMARTLAETRKALAEAYNHLERANASGGCGRAHEDIEATLGEFIATMPWPGPRGIKGL